MQTKLNRLADCLLDLAGHWSAKNIAQSGYIIFQVHILRVSKRNWSLCHFLKTFDIEAATDDKAAVILESSFELAYIIKF